MIKDTMRMFASILILILAPCCFITEVSTASAENDGKWWKNQIFYQILVDSFKDSDGDGLGDIRGIIKNIDYLKLLNVGAFILSPLYITSNNCDSQGVKDFKSIDNKYGTLEDFKEMLTTSRKLGFKVLLSLPLHSMSTESEWFKLSEKKSGSYNDFFIWNNADDVITQNASNSQTLAYDGWLWSSVKNQYFKKGIHGAALNLNDKNLFNEIKDAMRFWLDIGIDGFQVTLDDSDSLLYYDNVVEMRRLLNQFSVSQSNAESVLIIRTNTSPKLAMKYYGDNGLGGAQLVFSDDFFTKLDKYMSVRDVKYLIDTRMTYLPDDSTAAWGTGDAQHKRISSLLGNIRVDAMNTLALILPGAIITNQGDEIGMESSNNLDTYSQCSDTDTFESKTPFQWDDTTSAGFSTNPNTWLPVAYNYKFMNLKIQMKAIQSHFKMYQALAQARQSSTLKNGALILNFISDNILVAERRLKKKETFVAVLNFGSASSNADLSEYGFTELVVYTANEQSLFKMGDKVAADRISLSGGESIVFMSLSNECSNDGPVTKIVSKLNDAMHRINGFLGA